MPATARPSDETQQSLCQESLVEGLLGCLFDTTAGEESVGLICDRDCRVAECTEQTCACQWPDGQTCVATPSDDGFAAGGNLTTENDEQCVSRDEGQDSDACPDYCLVAAMSMGLGPQAGGDPGGGAGGGHQGQVWEDCDSCSMHTPAPDDCAPSSRDCVCSKMGSLPLGAWVTLCGSHRVLDGRGSCLLPSLDRDLRR